MCGLATLCFSTSALPVHETKTRYQGAQLVLGQDLQKAAGGQVQADTVRRLLSERLSPVVSQLMSEEEDSQSAAAAQNVRKMFVCMAYSIMVLARRQGQRHQLVV